MDVVRPKAKRQKALRVVITLATIGSVLGGSTLAFSRLGKFAPKVGRSALWVDTVQRGRFVREVRGNGTLVPEQSQLIVANSDGTVVRRLAEPGAALKAGDPIAQLANPEVEQQRDEARLSLLAARADLVDLTTKLQSQALGQAAMLAEVGVELHRSQAELRANEELAAGGTVAKLVLDQSRARWKELRTRSRIERRRLVMAHRSKRNQLTAQRARIEQLEAQLRLREQRVAGLVIKAPIAGVLQQVEVQLGQRLSAGAVIAKIADPARLRAELRVPETQARDVAPGQPTVIDTHNGVVSGAVLRVDPSAQNGSVIVVVTPKDKLPEGSRPDQTVEGTVTVEVAENVLYVGRPALAEKGATLGLFRLSGTSAVRVPVQLGRLSANTVEVLSGLAPGDQVILSDMSEWARHDKLRLN